MPGTSQMASSGISSALCSKAYEVCPPGGDEKLIRNLATLRFLDDASNVLFVWPPGVGKTMLSVALGRAAV